jgi:hypothetical protein
MFGVCFFFGASSGFYEPATSEAAKGVLLGGFAVILDSRLIMANTRGSVVLMSALDKMA